MKALRTKIVGIALLSILALISGFVFFEWWDLSFINYGWDYLNNQSVAVVLTFFLALFGYYLGFEYWKKQHKKELHDEYIRHFIEYIIRWYTIKKGQTNYRIKQTKANNDGDKVEERFCHERKMNLDSERNKVSGQIDFYKLMILKMVPKKDSNHKAILDIYKEYYDKFGKFEQEKVDSASYQEINLISPC